MCSPLFTLSRCRSLSFLWPFCHSKVLHGRPLRDYLRSLAELDGGGNPDYFMPKFKEVLITFQTVNLVDAVLFLKFFLILCVVLVLTSRRGGQLAGFS